MDYDKSLQKVIFNMICKEEYIFYSLFIAELNKSFTNKKGHSACVAKSTHNNSLQLIFGEKFWDENCPRVSQKTALVLHELLHVIHEHLSMVFDGMFTDKKVANYSMDIKINQEIKEEFPTNEKGETIGIFLNSFPELKLEPNKSTVYYYGMIMEAKKKKDDSKGKKDSLAGPPGNGEGSSGSKALDQLLDADEDIHSEWGELAELSDIEKELFKNEMQSMIQRVADETVKSRGTLPAGIDAILKTMITPDRPVVNWKTLFQRFIGSTTSVEQYQTRKRPNLRFEDSPSTKNKYKVAGIVLCDSSGSMSDNDIDQINSQLYHIFKAGVAVDFTSWDAECDKHKKYDGKLTFERTKAGGTRMGCAIEYVNENYRKNNWSFAVIGSDGFVEQEVPRCKIPCLIVVTQSGTIDIGTSHKIIKIP